MDPSILLELKQLGFKLWNDLPHDLHGLSAAERFAVEMVILSRGTPFIQFGISNVPRGVRRIINQERLPRR